MGRRNVDTSSILVDRSSPMPLYFQVAQQLEREIRAGVLAPGDRIANEISLAQQLGLSRPTLRQAIQLLVDKGLVVRKRGVGTQVVGREIRRAVELTSLHDDLRRAGQKPRTEVLSCRREPGEEAVAAELSLPAGAPVWRLERLRRVEEEPLALMLNYLPVDRVDLDPIDFGQVGLYEALRGLNVHIRVAHQRIGARRADTREARLLDSSRGAPLLTVSRTAFDDAGRAIEYGKHLYRPERYSFEITLVNR